MAATNPNAYLIFNGEKFPLYVKRMSYPLQTMHKGDSQSRRGYTLYPYRVVRGDIALTVVFRSVDDYKKFGAFIAKYHQSVVGNGYGVMRFMSSRRTYDNMGISSNHYIDYGVTIEKLNLAVAYDIPAAPELSFNMYILDDEYMGQASASTMTGSVEDMVGDNIVRSGAISSRGDNAFKAYVNKAELATESGQYSQAISYGADKITTAQIAKANRNKRDKL